MILQIPVMVVEMVPPTLGIWSHAPERHAGSAQTCRQGTGGRPKQLWTPVVRQAMLPVAARERWQYTQVVRW
jgi:hypothetical protein